MTYYKHKDKEKKKRGRPRRITNEEMTSAEDSNRIYSQDNSDRKENKNMKNINDYVSDEPANQPIERVRLNSDQTAIIQITPSLTEVDTHFCQESEIKNTVLCNGDDCLNCKTGKKKDTKLLLPVYLPTEDRIGVLPMSKSLRPTSLLPQIARIMKSGKSVVTFIVRDEMKYTVTTSELPADINLNEEVIQNFLDNFNAGLIDLSSVYQKIDNSELALVPEIARMMVLKGIKV